MVTIETMTILTLSAKLEGRRVLASFPHLAWIGRHCDQFRSVHVYIYEMCVQRSLLFSFELLLLLKGQIEQRLAVCWKVMNTALFSPFLKKLCSCGWL